MRPRYFRFLTFAALASLLACTADPTARGNLYTYVDAQGNLVTVERPAAEQGQGSGAGSQATPAGGAGPGADLPASAYQTDEEVQQKLEERDRNRFVTYYGPDGQLIEEKVDLVAEREYRQERPPGYEAVADPAVEFVERITGVRADCCLHTREQARPLDVGEELSLALGDADEVVVMDRPMPAMAVRLTAAVGRLTLRGFIGKAGDYLHPALVFMDGEGTPLEVVDRPFQRRYPETWYRYAFYQGVLSVPPGARYVAFYLPYATVEEGAGVVALPQQQGYYDAPPALAGDFTVTGSAGER
ncbi:MAG: hypothetical protein P1U64_14335 [Alcanivoracaceae bacterium]|jgi:hypothetical protein|nr:hypothetical protein [Alcanivoracaceae bacterium]